MCPMPPTRKKRNGKSTPKHGKNESNDKLKSYKDTRVKMNTLVCGYFSRRSLSLLSSLSCLRGALRGLPRQTIGGLMSQLAEVQVLLAAAKVLLEQAALTPLA